MANRLITGLTPAREQALQERLMIRLARQAEKPIQREIQRATRSIARGDDGAEEIHQERLNRIITSLYTTAFDTFGRRLWNAVKKSTMPTEIKRDQNIPLTPQFDLARKIWIKAVAAQKVTQIAGTTSEQAKKIIQQAAADAIEQGLDEKQTASLIQSRIADDGGRLSRLRSRVISRTESHSASNASNQMAVQASGVPMMKEWIASGGERTRENHLFASGQTAKLDEPFVVGSDYLMQPGDPGGSPEEIINCRCALGYYLP
tara:strand:+ start:3992 stop:4774 length:783 start_codon:yes stop_codon:yes gene_type:complete